MKRYAIGIAVVLFAAALALISVEGHAYNAYSNTQCSNCHGSFQNRGTLHDVHTGFISDCGICHPSNPGSTPVSTFQGNDPANYSCLGCHGRDYGGATGMQSAGLRAFHLNQQSVNCTSVCHGSDPSPLGENIDPVQYGYASVSITNACSDNLDNDGDGLRDANDPDCSTPVEPSTWGRVKALYRAE